MAIPSPQELDLPEKFKSFRQVQVDALEKILASQKKWILVQAPTGIGKTLLAAALQKITGQSMLYTCTNKDLQDQFINDFPYAVELKGRENYPTAFYPNINCGMCTKTKDDPRCRWCCPPDCLKKAPCLKAPYLAEDSRCVGDKYCPYEMQKRVALSAKLAVLNTAIFLNEANYVGGFSRNKKWIVIDECDQLETSLMSFVEVSISGSLIKRLGLDPPARKTVEEAWVEWLKKEALPKVEKRLAKLENSGRGISDLREIREVNELKRIYDKLVFFRQQVKNSLWANCTEDMENGPWVWKPVFVGKFAEKYIWRHADKFLLMSATIISKDQFCRNLGIPADRADYIELPSLLPKENRPVYFAPVADMTHKTLASERPKLVDAIDAILNLHQREKALVHTVSYSLARYIHANSRHCGRMVVYDDAKSRHNALETYKSSPYPLVIIAPSMERGIDLPGDLCRVVIIAKVPFRSLGDNQVRKRLYSAADGRSWYAADAIRTIVQMCGRGVRNESDWAITYIIDAQFGRLYREWKNFFPAWWREALKTLSPGQLAEGVTLHVNTFREGMAL